MANKSNFVTTDFTKKEVNIMMFALRFKSFDVDPNTNQPFQRHFPKKDEVVAMETFKELKKGMDDEKNVSLDCKLAFGTQQKTLLLDCMDSIEWNISDIEHKLSASEKLK